MRELAEGLAYRRNQSKFRDLMLTNKDLANFIGSTRESVNRMLHELRKEKVISTEDGYITVHNIIFLKEFLECESCPDDICRI